MAMNERQNIRKRRIFGAVPLCVWAILMCGLPWDGIAQSRFPKSFVPESGVHISTYDGRDHKSAVHYEALCHVVHEEFGLTNDSIRVNLVFVDSSMMKLLTANNPARFHGTEWQGVFIKPYMIIMLGEEESDDTFMHEYMHALQQRGLLFAQVHPSVVHQVIYENEGLLLGSKSYLQFLKSRQ